MVNMKKIIAFQILCLAIIIIAWIAIATENVPSWVSEFSLAVYCVLTAAAGGVLYCIRAIYINKCVRKYWDDEWATWYYLRPLASSLTGFAAYIFLKAGLVILDAEESDSSSIFGFLAFAFIAGLNVDKFVLKIEDIAQSAFGIEKSRTANDSK